MVLAALFRKLFGGAKRLDAFQAKKLLDEDERVVIIDVRQAGEFRGGHLPGARHVPVGLMPQKAQRMDKDATYLVYCQRGSRSSRAAAAMTRAGMRNVHNLHGGIAAWQRAGFPVVKK